MRSPLQNQKARECKGEVKYLEDYRKKADEVRTYISMAVCMCIHTCVEYVYTYIRSIDVLHGCTYSLCTVHSMPEI